MDKREPLIFCGKLGLRSIETKHLENRMTVQTDINRQDLQALFDRSDGFYRRQLVLTTKEKPAGRVDDPDLAEKMKAEVEGILLWAFEGLQRLVANHFKFTESQRTKDNRETVKRDNNNVFDFMESDGYIRLKADCSISSKELYEIYRMWCEENNLTPLKRRSFSDAVIASQNKYIGIYLMKNHEGYHDPTAGKAIRRAREVVKRRDLYGRKMRPLTYKFGDLSGVPVILK